MKNENPNWIITHGGGNEGKPFGHECLRCRAYHKLPQNLKVGDFIKIGLAFIELHKYCEKN